MTYPPPPKQVYIETYGCQMNVADSELVGGILRRAGYAFTQQLAEADVVLVNTCAVRENAERRALGRLGLLNRYKRQNPRLVVGVLGCMAERLRARFMGQGKLVDLVVGPDEYRKLPGLIGRAFEGGKSIAVQLSRVENYDDIEPLRADGTSAWVPVMRGCDKFCSFCVVPFTRGRERSRALQGILREVEGLVTQGFREVTLLGQNVNCYRDADSDFADLMRCVAAVEGLLRVRFITSHPQDMSEKLIDTIAANEKLCKHIHLPVQSGSDRILALMNRTYTVDHYLRLVDKIRRAMPAVSLTTDIISGFPTETEPEHALTMALVRQVHYDGAYTFKYSAREHTKAWEMMDDVPEEEKGRRVSEVTQLQHDISLMRNLELVGSIQRVLVEGPSKKSQDEFTGRTDTNKTAVFPHNGELVGEMIDIQIERVSSATLMGVKIGGGQRRVEPSYVREGTA